MNRVNGTLKVAADISERICLDKQALAYYAIVLMSKFSTFIRKHESGIKRMLGKKNYISCLSNNAYMLFIFY